MHHNRWAASNARSPVLANRGIRLFATSDAILYEQRHQQQSLTAEPAGSQSSDAMPLRLPLRLPLPRMPSTLLERTAGLARCFWRRHRRSLTMLLYLDTTQASWHPILPPQSASQTDGHVDFREAHIDLAPQYRLAGSFRSLPNVDRQQVALAVSPFDGMHFVLDPCRSWLSVLCFIHIEERILPFALDHFIHDEDDRELDLGQHQIRLVDEL